MSGQWEEWGRGYAAPADMPQRTPEVAPGVNVHVRALQVVRVEDEQVAVFERETLEALQKMSTGSGSLQEYELPGLSGKWVVYAEPWGA